MHSLVGLLVLSGKSATLVAQVPRHQTTSRARCQFALASATRLPALAMVDCDYRGRYQLCALNSGTGSTALLPTRWSAGTRTSSSFVCGEGGESDTGPVRSCTLFRHMRIFWVHSLGVFLVLSVSPATHVAQVRSHHTTSHARCQLALASATSLPALAIVDCDYRGPYQCAPQTLAQDLLCCCQHDGRQVHARLPLSYAEKVVSRIWDLSAPAPCSAHASFRMHSLVGLLVLSVSL